MIKLKMWRFIITTGILILAIILRYLPSVPEPVLKRVSLSNFPSKIGDWSIVNELPMDCKSIAVLRVDDYINRIYSNSRGEIVELYIGYFKTQKEGKENHSPRQCLPGSGWTAVKTASLMISVSGNDPGQIPVNEYLMVKGTEKELFLFWYDGRGRQIANEYLAKAYLVWDSITRNRTDGALIRINSVASPNPENALETQEEFIRSFFPVLSKFIPE